MKIKILLQILLFLFASIILFFTFYNYGSKTINTSSSSNLIQAENNSDETLKSSIDESDKSIPNVLKDAVYENFNNDGNKYKIYADISEFKELNSKKIFMKGVRAIINLDSESFLTISSEEAIFDNESLETQFSKNVVLDYLDHNIKGESLELLFDKNLITMQDQIIYRNIDTELIADKIIIDLITKNSKIVMNDEKNKIKILNKN
tara:strand:- start:332 stop:949 length:618 start_codon:yes stop_codon:yes gene_type:complete